jgi:hypothetical protein
MGIHITDLPLELFQLALILCLGIVLYIQNRAVKRGKAFTEKKLSETMEELKHLRRLLDRILMVEKGYDRPSANFDDQDPDSNKDRNSRHFK